MLNKIIFAALFVLVVSTVSSAEQARTKESINAALLSTMDKQEASKVIGKPSKCEKSKYGEKCYFKNGAIEIVFIDNKADWITLYPANLDFVWDSLSAIGVERKQPDSQDDLTIRWKNISGLVEVSMHRRGKDLIDFFYVKSSTP